MNTIHSMALGLVIAMGGWARAAQEASILPEQLPQAPQAQMQRTLTAENSSTRVSSSVMPDYSLAIANARTHPVRHPRTIDRKFLIVNGLHLGMAILDTEMTQHCIASHHCREGNPLMPSSQAGQLAVDFAFVAYGSGFSYWFKKHKSHLWWLPPTGGIVAHTAGVATGLLHR